MPNELDVRSDDFPALPFAPSEGSLRAIAGLGADAPTAATVPEGRRLDGSALVGPLDERGTGFLVFSVTSDGDILCYVPADAVGLRERVADVTVPGEPRPRARLDFDGVIVPPDAVHGPAVARAVAAWERTRAAQRFVELAAAAVAEGLVHDRADDARASFAWAERSAELAAARLLVAESVARTRDGHPDESAAAEACAYAAGVAERATREALRAAARRPEALGDAAQRHLEASVRAAVDAPRSRLFKAIAARAFEGGS